MYKTNLNSEWGTLFGLTPSDLTDEQLAKISFAKLTEFLGFDPRVEDILGNKLFKAPIKELFRLDEIKPEIASRTNFISKYNQCLKTRRPEIDKNNDYYYGRNKIIMWEFLDDENKEYEFNKWINGTSSVINEDNVDYKWLYSHKQDLADKVVSNIFTKATGWRVSHAAKNLLANLPKEELIKHIPTIFAKDKYFFIHSLSNPNTPDEFILKSLRAIAKLTDVPKIKVKISNKILNDLPPVTRLEVLEKVMYSCESSEAFPFSDIKNPEDLQQLVFSTTTRHYDRVSNLVIRYKRLVNWRDK